MSIDYNFAYMEIPPAHAQKTYARICRILDKLAKTAQPPKTDTITRYIFGVFARTTFGKPRTPNPDLIFKEVARNIGSHGLSLKEIGAEKKSGTLSIRRMTDLDIINVACSHLNYPIYRAWENDPSTKTILDKDLRTLTRQDVKNLLKVDGHSNHLLHDIAALMAILHTRENPPTEVVDFNAEKKKRAKPDRPPGLREKLFGASKSP